VSLSHWRMIFAAFAILAISVGFWFWRAQAETLATGDRKPFTFGQIWRGIKEVVSTRQCFGYGLASMINSRLVLKFGMRAMCRWSLWILCVVGFVFVVFSVIRGGDPGFAGFMLFMFMASMLVAILFGNFNALAMEPMGHIAGIAASVAGSLTTLISLAIGAGISATYNGTSLPLLTGYAVCGVLAWIMMGWTERSAQRGR